MASNKLYLLFVLLFIPSCRAFQDIKDTEFCNHNLTRNQLLINVTRNHSQCLLWCDILDLSKPIGSLDRFPMRIKEEHLIPCNVDRYNDGHWCWKGKCLNVDEELMDNFYPPPWSPKRIPPIDMSDIEIRKCYKNLTFLQWTVNIESKNEKCLIDCEILDTSYEIGHLNRSFHSLHRLTNSSCVDSNHVCVDGACVRKSLAPNKNLKEFQGCTDEEKQEKNRICSERKSYCDQLPESLEWRGMECSLRRACSIYERECSDVPGFEPHRWI